ncbi:hypothetical protein sS8_2196 [Methylocaldum marinum]|uniref:Uncharacterized protein n=1 Tax=Methylocaldum marinum TaxID=1432792 RepID=A0A250KR88_9GAMM|nr:hypothetical protein sS8_2196 [Methylocaldum marinum]
MTAEPSAVMAVAFEVLPPGNIPRPIMPVAWLQTKASVPLTEADDVVPPATTEPSAETALA